MSRYLVNPVHPVGSFHVAHVSSVVGGIKVAQFRQLAFCQWSMVVSLALRIAIRAVWHAMHFDFYRLRRPACFVLLCTIAAMHAFDCEADEAVGSPQIERGEKQKATSEMLQRYCIKCHGADTQEADLRVDILDLEEAQNNRGETLERILNAVRRGNMPPEDAESPSTGERAILVRGLEDQLSMLPDPVAQPGFWTGNRRLTVEEYNFTMQDLFAVDAEFVDMLPADPLSYAGYRNDRERLGLSSLQIEAYLDSARRAVDRYVQFDEFKLPPLRYHIELEDLFYATADRYGTREHAPQPIDLDSFAARQAAGFDSPPRYVDPLGPRLPGAFSDDETLRAAIPKLNQQFVAIPQRLPIGEMTLRIRAAGTPDRVGRFPRMRVEAGITLGDGCSIDKRVLGEVDVTASIDEPTVYEFRMRLEDVPTKGRLRDEDSFDRLSVFDMDQVFISNVSTDSQAIFALGRGGYSDPDSGSREIAKPLEQMANGGVNFLFLDSLQIEMVPGSDANNRPYRWQVPNPETAAEPQQEIAIAREFLGRFMPKAYRRPIAPIEVETKLKLFEDLREENYSFEDGLQETLAAVLVSPSFLFLESSPPTSIATEPTADELDSHTTGTVTPHELASRLAYLLWLSPPDERLTKRANDGSLLNRDVLLSEANRLLADPRSRRFMESFCRQWMRLDKLQNIAVNRQRYPTYDEDLADLSVRETLDYFIEVFTTDSSVLDLIDSNYVMLNDRLAEHYNLDLGDLLEDAATDAIGGQFRKIPLPRDSVRRWSADASERADDEFGRCRLASDSPRCLAARQDAEPAASPTTPQRSGPRRERSRFARPHVEATDRAAPPAGSVPKLSRENRSLGDSVREL